MKDLIIDGITGVKYIELYKLFKYSKAHAMINFGLFEVVVLNINYYKQK